jgi:hypothetical protein
MQMALFLCNPVFEWEEEVLQLHKFLTNTLCGDKWSAAHVGHFVPVEVTAWSVCPSASVGALEKKKRLQWQYYNR